MTVSPEDFKSVWQANQTDLEPIVDKALREAYESYRGSDTFDLDLPLDGGEHLSGSAVVLYLMSKGFDAQYVKSCEVIEIQVSPIR